jgi:hypothetical protein
MEPGDAIKYSGSAFLPGALCQSAMGRVAVVQDESVSILGEGGNFPIKTHITLPKLLDDWCLLRGIDRTQGAAVSSRGALTEPLLIDPTIRPPETYAAVHQKSSADGTPTSIIRPRTLVPPESIPRSTITSACWSELPRVGGHFRTTSTIGPPLFRFNPELHPNSALECLAVSISICDFNQQAVAKEVAAENFVMIIPLAPPGSIGDVLESPASHLSIGSLYNSSNSTMDVDPANGTDTGNQTPTPSLGLRPFFHPSHIMISPCVNYEEHIIGMAWLPTPILASETQDFFWSQYLAIAVRDTLQFWRISYGWSDAKPSFADTKLGKAELVCSFSPFSFPKSMLPGWNFGTANSTAASSSTKIIEKLQVIPSAESQQSASLFVSYREGHLERFTISFEDEKAVNSTGEPAHLDFYGQDESTVTNRFRIFPKWQISLPEVSSAPLTNIRSLSFSDIVYAHGALQRDQWALIPGTPIPQSLSTKALPSAAKDIIALSSSGWLCLLSEEDIQQKDSISTRDNDGFMAISPSFIIQAHTESISGVNILPNDTNALEGTIQFQLITSGLDGWIRTWRVSKNVDTAWKCDLINEQEFTMILESQAGAGEENEQEPSNALRLLQLPSPNVPANHVTFLSSVMGLVPSPNGLYALACLSPPYRELRAFHYLFYIRLLPHSIISAIRSVSAKFAANWSPLAIGISDICTLAKSLPPSALSRLAQHTVSTFPPTRPNSDHMKLLLQFPVAETLTVSAILCKWLQTNLSRISIASKSPEKASKAIKVDLSPNKNFENTTKTLFISRVPDSHAKSDSFSLNYIILTLIQMRSVGFLQHIIHSLSRLSLLHSKSHPIALEVPTSKKFSSSIDTKALSRAEWTVLTHFAVLLSDALGYLPASLLPLGERIMTSIDVLLARLSDKTPNTRLQRLAHLKQQRSHQQTATQISSKVLPTSLESLFETSERVCGYCEGHCENSFPSSSFPLFALSCSKLSDDLNLTCSDLELPIVYCSASGIPIGDISAANVCLHCGGLTLGAQI